jgi:isoleucyl-tRNA synthetase
MLAPILVHTAEEAWAVMKSSSEAKGHNTQYEESVHLALMPKADESIDWQSQESKWQKLMGLRDDVLRILEGLRQEKKIASNQEASVTICCDDKAAAVLHEFGFEQFAALCIVSEVKVEKAAGETTIAAQRSSFKKCQRCWNYWPSVGSDTEYLDLCERCVSVVHRA